MRRTPVVSLALCSSLLVPSAARAADTDVRVSSIGYVTGRAKHATVAASSSTAFSVKEAGDGTSVLDGTLSAPATDPETGVAVQQADFTACDQGSQPPSPSVVGTSAVAAITILTRSLHPR